MAKNNYSVNKEILKKHKKFYLNNKEFLVKTTIHSIERNNFKSFKVLTGALNKISLDCNDIARMLEVSTKHDNSFKFTVHIFKTINNQKIELHPIQKSFLLRSTTAQKQTIILKNNGFKALQHDKIEESPYSPPQKQQKITNIYYNAEIAYITALISDRYISAKQFDVAIVMARSACKQIKINDNNSLSIAKNAILIMTQIYQIIKNNAPFKLADSILKYAKKFSLYEQQIIMYNEINSTDFSDAPIATKKYPYQINKIWIQLVYRRSATFQ